MTFRNANFVSILALVCLCSILPAFGQTEVTPSAPAATAWDIGMGVEANTYGNLPAYMPFVSISACWTGFCSISTIEFGSGAATVRQDLGYKVKATPDGSTMLIALVGGSLTSTSTPGSVLPSNVMLGGLGGGFAVRVDPGIIPFLKAIKGKGVGVRASVREASVTSVGVKPQIAFSLDYRFKK